MTTPMSAPITASQERGRPARIPHEAGGTPALLSQTNITGHWTTLDGAPFYRIEGAEHMPVFLMSLVSASDLWMFVASNGALTAGRRNTERPLFPYMTEDRVCDSAGVNGPRTIIEALNTDGTKSLWEPFAQLREGGHITRALMKNVAGDCLVFEETNHALGLRFTCSWSGSPEFGFVRAAELANVADQARRIRILDGLKNILPALAGAIISETRSCVLDAYKQNQLIPAARLGIYALASQPVDRPEPREALRASLAWSLAPDNFRVSIAPDNDERLLRGKPLDESAEICGRRGAYWLSGEADLAPGKGISWRIVADTHWSQAEVATLLKKLEAPDALASELDASLQAAHRSLVDLVAKTDGLQETADVNASAHHFANVLFNDMRGGVYADGYNIDTALFAQFVREWNRPCHGRSATALASLPPTMHVEEFRAAVDALGDADLSRLALEYLPLTFSRRHGDPSRPWNRFDIHVQTEDKHPVLAYQGNWRDIFQNWEALSLSFPDFLPNIIAKFVNATTAEGFNPFRISNHGFDWEVPEPGNPWSHIGYWGDHQIIYLQRLLEMQRRFFPQALERALPRDIFVYASLPYRMRAFDDILADPRSTIDFVPAWHDASVARQKEIGADGKLLHKDGDIARANLLEKLLVPLLSKMSNFVPNGGIWMNTQRPEWNDADNALVGNGLSMITLNYLHRFAAFLADVLRETKTAEFPLHSAVANWMSAVRRAMEQNAAALAQPQLDAKTRRNFVEAVGRAFEAHRARVLADGLGEAKAVATVAVRDFLDDCLAWLEHTIASSKRPDGLYHTYNLMRVTDDGIEIDTLHEMLEGQVAALCSPAFETLDLPDVARALESSKLRREDQHSYILYPDRKLPLFLEKNRLGREADETLDTLAPSARTRLFREDPDGTKRFAPDFHNADALAEAMEPLVREGAITADANRRIVALYEEVFNHHAFTGRSGTMYAYEGLGSIYWHMVAKLLLAVQEQFYKAVDACGAADPAPAKERGHLARNSEQLRAGRPRSFASAETATSGVSADTIRRIAELYYDVRQGIGFNKSPGLYGAFPIDPYSHTPGGRGARQPGMTGQVKEEVLTRFGELGVRVRDGRLSFEPALLRASEFFSEKQRFDHLALDGTWRTIELTPTSLAFTFAQVPVVYTLAKAPSCEIITADGKRRAVENASLTREDSLSVFLRRGKIAEIRAHVVAGL